MLMASSDSSPEDERKSSTPKSVIGREGTDTLDFGDVDNSTESEGVLTPVIDTDVDKMEEESSDIIIVSNFIANYTYMLLLSIKVIIIIIIL